MNTAPYYTALGCVDGAAVLVLLVLLLRGPLRRFWVLAVHAAWTVLGTFSMAAFDMLRTPAQNNLYNHLYWVGEITVDLPLFLVIIALAHQATPEGSLRRKIDRLLAAAAGVVLILS